MLTYILLDGNYLIRDAVIFVPKHLVACEFHFHSVAFFSPQKFQKDLEQYSVRNRVGIAGIHVVPDFST